jgi:hypothetical protein
METTFEKRRLNKPGNLLILVRPVKPYFYSKTALKDFLQVFNTLKRRDVPSGVSPTDQKRRRPRGPP